MPRKRALHRQSRAALRKILAGNDKLCEQCKVLLKFNTAAGRRELEQVICNVYERGVWKRVEHYHPDCYTLLGEPYGAAAA